jgi:hypothetical protein
LDKWSKARICLQIEREFVRSERQFGGMDMGKYFLAWLIGVPATVLVLVYVIMHV